MDKNHQNKMIAPIIIGVLLALYYIGFFVVCGLMPMPFLMKLLFGVIPLLLAGVCIYVLVERINEIRSGEEDDLSEY